VEGGHRLLAKIGYSRDRKRATLRVGYGLVTDGEGCPSALEVVTGNTGGPKTVAAKVEKIKRRFHVKGMVLVGDRGMLTGPGSRICARTLGSDWISALRSPQIRALLDSDAIQMGLFDQCGLAEISHPDYPGERLVVCSNPDLAQKSKRKREDLLRATGAKLQPILEAVAKGTLEGAARIGLRVGRVLNQYEVGKHFTVEIFDHAISFARDPAKISAEAELDGTYVIRTSASPERLTAPAGVRTYKGLKHMKHAFRTWKGLNIQERSIHHWSSERVKAHILLCMLAYSCAGTWSGPGRPCCSATTKPAAGFRTRRAGGEAELIALKSDHSPGTNGPISSSSPRSRTTRWLPHAPPPPRCAKRQPSNWTTTARCPVSSRC